MYLTDFILFLDPSLLTQRPVSVSVLVGKSLQRSCASIGYPAPIIQWSYVTENGSRNISGSISNYISLLTNGSYSVESVLEFTSLTESDDGQYLCTASNTLLGDTAREEAYFNISIWSKERREIEKGWRLGEKRRDGVERMRMAIKKVLLCIESLLRIAIIIYESLVKYNLFTLH